MKDTIYKKMKIGQNFLQPALRAMKVCLLLWLLWLAMPQHVAAQMWSLPLYSTCFLEDDFGHCREWGATTRGAGTQLTLLGYISSVDFPAALALYDCVRENSDGCADRGVTTSSSVGDLLGYIAPTQIQDTGRIFNPLYSVCKREDGSGVCQDWGANTDGSTTPTNGPILLGYISP